MYTIYADGKLLYAPHLFHEGCGVFSPKLTVELNKAGSLSYILPPNNSQYDSVQKLKSVITAYQDTEELFRGRVLHDDKDFYKQKNTYCEGGLAYLLDSTVRPYTFTGTIKGLFEKFISEHNSRVDVEKQFTVGDVTLAGNVSCNNMEYPVTFDEITNQILNVYGGYLKLRRVGNVTYIDLIGNTDNPSVTTQTIEFGRNLLDLSEHITAENVFTVIIPIGKSLQDEEGNDIGKLTITDANNGKDYIEDSTAISLFGRIEKKVEWSDIESASELKTLGENYLENNIEMAVTLDVKAVDLHLIDVDVERIRVGDWVTVISVPHGLNKAFQCTKIVYDMVNPDQNEYVFGINFSSLTEQQVSSKKSMQNSVSMVLSTASAASASVNKANQVITDAENVIAQIPTEYVKTTTFEEYKTTADGKFALKIDFDALVARVETLEGGTT